MPVKVESLRRKDGLYQVETSPNIIFDMSDMFDLDNFDNAFYALDEMLLTSVDLYRDDPKFFNASRSNSEDITRASMPAHQAPQDLANYCSQKDGVPGL